MSAGVHGYRWRLLLTSLLALRYAHQVESAPGSGRPSEPACQGAEVHYGRLVGKPRSRRSNRPYAIGAVAVLSVRKGLTAWETVWSAAHDVVDAMAHVFLAGRWGTRAGHRVILALDGKGMGG